jgi:WD40 repeat protein
MGTGARAELDPSKAKWKLWDTADPKNIRLLASEDGIATASIDGRWLVGLNSPLVKREGGTPPFAPIFAGFGTRAVIRNLESGEAASRIEAPPGNVFLVAHRAEFNGRRIALISSPTPQAGASETPAGLPVRGGPFTLRLYDIPTGKELWSAESGRGGMVEFPPPFSRDRNCISVGIRDGEETRVHVHNLADGVLQRSFTIPGASRFLAQTNDGQLVFSGRDGLTIWNPTNGIQTHKLPDEISQIGWPRAIAVSPDNRRLFAAEMGINPKTRCIHVWDLTTDRELLRVPSPNINSVVFRARFGFTDGKLRYSSTDGVRVLDGTPLPEPAK